MSLTKEECLQSLCRIQCGAKQDKKCEDCDCFDNKINIWKCVENIKESLLIRQLINEHFELVELLKKHDLENLSIKELDAWMNRSLWHVNKVNELSNILVELSRDVKSKDKRIEQLEKQKEELIESYTNEFELRKELEFELYDLKLNLPLKFEELKEGMWVWDNKIKEYIFIFEPLNWKPIKGLRYANQVIYYSAEGYYTDFEENRFFRNQVEE